MDDRIALFDMDGTLFDYDGQLREDLAKLSSPGEELPDRLYDYESNPAWLNARIDLIRQQPGWWRNLPRLKIGWQILKACQSIGFSCCILTKGPRSKSVAWMEKLDCVNNHLGCGFPVNMVNSGDDGNDKENVYGRILVDDYAPFLLNWLKHRKRGLGIMPVSPGNNVDIDNPNVFCYHGLKDMPKLKRVLKAVFARESKQHWRDLV